MIKNNGTTSIYRMGALAASLAIVALLVGGVALAISGSANPVNVDQLLSMIDDNLLTFAIGYIAIVLVSLFDIYTVPGLYSALWRDSHTLTGIAAITAILGDLLGVTGGLLQISMLPMSRRLSEAASAAGSPLLASAETVVALESVFSTAGFLLIGVSFVCFGFAILRGAFGKWIGWVALAAGVFSILGQIPLLAMLFILANVTFLLWYIGIGTRFYRLAKES